MNPDQVLLVFATGGVAKIIQNYDKIQFHDLHLAWFPPIVLNLVFCSINLSFEQFNHASNVFIVAAYLNYLPLICLLILLLPLDYKYNKEDCFCFLKYTIDLKFRFYLFLIVHTLFSFPALIFLSGSLTEIWLGSLVTAMLVGLYFLGMKYTIRFIHWFAIIMTVLVKVYYLFFSNLAEYIF